MKLSLFLRFHKGKQYEYNSANRDIPSFLEFLEGEYKHEPPISCPSKHSEIPGNWSDFKDALGIIMVSNFSETITKESELTLKIIRNIQESI